MSRVHGVDSSNAMRTHAGKKYLYLQLRQGSATDELPYPAEFADAVISSNMLDLADSPDVAIAEMYRILKPGGRLVLTTPRDRIKLSRIITAHICQRGPWSVISRAPAMLLVCLLNMLIVRESSHHFFTREALQNLTGATASEIETTYADQAWIIAVTKSSTPELIVRTASTDADRAGAHALVHATYHRLGFTDQPIPAPLRGRNTTVATVRAHKPEGHRCLRAPHAPPGTAA